MSRLRTNPNRYTCQQWIGLLPKYGKGGHYCDELAVIRCNACKQYFCEECWQDHFEMTVVVERSRE